MSCLARCLFVVACVMLPAYIGASSQQTPAGRTFIVDCSGNAAPVPAGATRLASLEDVNALTLISGDNIFFQRGTVCHGALHPRGSGFKIDATGTGALPIIEAGPKDEATLRLFNQEEISVSSLDLRGGTKYGIFVSGDKGIMHNISLTNLSVSKTRGRLLQKESGLVVFRPASPAATFEDLRLDQIRAFDTTQWSGIFIAGGSREHPVLRATVTHSLVHDVQGDGIVIFNGADSSIRHSLAWHTGMQHQQSIGTPNAIWTWQCNVCLVQENEAFLTDSPGVDGGAFDIDWGNTRNTVQGNFGHDTQGYCVSVFAANGPTVQSSVRGNLCLNNGLSPRLAQRQGAILLMTWSGGSIDGLDIAGNRIDWRPAGDTPAVRTGTQLQASGVTMHDNEIHTTSTHPVDDVLTYRGAADRYFLESATPGELTAAKRHLTHEPDAQVAPEPIDSELRPRAVRSIGWRLVAIVPSRTPVNSVDLPSLFVNLKTAAIEYARGGLAISLQGNPELLMSARDWSLHEDGVELKPAPSPAGPALSLQLVSPAGKIVRTWSKPASPIDLGLALRRFIGAPVYGRLSLEQVRATD